MADVLLEVSGIDVFYRDVQVLRDVSMTVAEGEIVTVIGPNGAGKSTLLHTIVGYQHPRKGGITFHGTSIGHLPPERIVRLGLTSVPEGARVFSEMTVLENLQMGSYVKSARARRSESLEQVFTLFPRLEERKSQKGGTLSGGERQMLAIGRALMLRPTLLLLDEPSLGLAPLVVRRIFSVVKAIVAMGLTVLLVEQNVNMSLEVTDRAYVLENGCVALHGPGRELMMNDHVKKSYLAM